MPAIECHCGVPIDVEEFEAGSSKNCPTCGESNRIPSLAKLRMLDGETNPYLDSTSRLIAAIQESRAPFDGNCIKCNQRATVEYPVRTRFLKERVSADSPIHMGVVGVTFDFSADEQWIKLKIPFRFCQNCGREFRRRALVGRLMLFLGMLAAIGLGIPILIVAHVFGALLIFPLIWGISQVAGRVRADRRLDPYLKRHSVLRTVFSGQDELVIRIGWPRRL
jgi:hypothetical protein